MTTILLTGVTGLIGSCLAPLLKERGYRILYLIRPNGSKDAVTRLREVIGEVVETDIAIDGDITSPHAGINESDRQRWKGKIDKVVHCAASVKFDEALSEEIFFTNLTGTRNLLALADDLRIPEFHFVSTAYIAGNATVFSEKDFDIGQITRNPYESSKKQAEALVRGWSGGKFSIYRPSVIVGDSQSGSTPTFDGYYGFFIHFWRLLKTLQSKLIGMEDVERYGQQGIQFRNGFLELPLRLDCSLTSTINLVPIDWVVRSLNDLIALSAENQTYHLVHPSPPRVQWVIEISLAILGIKGLKYVEGVEVSSPLVERLQSGLNKAYARYKPYSTHEARFTRHNLCKTLNEQCLSLPTIDEAFLVRMLDYAKSVDFGRAMHFSEAILN